MRICLAAASEALYLSDDKYSAFLGGTDSEYGYRKAERDAYFSEGRISKSFSIHL